VRPILLVGVDEPETNVTVFPEIREAYLDLVAEWAGRGSPVG
jgi:hypothetical protein